MRIREPCVGCWLQIVCCRPVARFFGLGARRFLGGTAPECRPWLQVWCAEMHCIEESTCDVVGTFRRAVIRGPPQWFGARGIVPPCPPSLRPCVQVLTPTQCRRCDQRRIGLLLSSTSDNIRFLRYSFVKCKCFY